MHIWKIPLEVPRCKWKKCIKVHLKKYSLNVRVGFVSRDKHKWKAVVDTVMKLLSVGGGRVDGLSKYQLVNKGSTLWSY